MAPGAGFNIPHSGDILDIERAFTSVHVQLVQAVYCGGGIQALASKSNEARAQHSAGAG